MQPETSGYPYGDMAAGHTVARYNNVEIGVHVDDLTGGDVACSSGGRLVSSKLLRHLEVFRIGLGSSA